MMKFPYKNRDNRNVIGELAHSVTDPSIFEGVRRVVSI